MLREERTEVLVIGAGPVGMLTALLLSRHGIQVKIIDQEWHTAARTYACALHPRTLKLLDPLGVSRAAMAAGCGIETIAFYEGEDRQAQVKLSQLPVDFPFLAVLPQSRFEEILEQKLQKEGVLSVQWNHQLSDLRDDGHSILATVDRLGVSAKGYGIPEMDWSVEKTESIRADFLVGADGPNSFLAQTLALGQETAGESEFYAVYEFQSDWQGANELRIVVDEDTTSVLWPLAEDRFRWSFQLRQEHLSEFPIKERKLVRIGDPEQDGRSLKLMQTLLRERAPWFNAEVRDVVWSADVEFAHRLAARFGRHRCWLTGDAAHQTGPAGMQSMNLGLLEAERLSNALVKVLREQAPLSQLDDYDRESRAQWRRLLGWEGSIVPRSSASPWLRRRAARLLSCLPSSGEDLDQLLGQLQLDLV